MRYYHGGSAGKVHCLDGASAAVVLPPIIGLVPVALRAILYVKRMGNENEARKSLIRA